MRRIGELPGRRSRGGGHDRAVARRRRLRPGLSILRRGVRARPTVKKIRAPGSARSRLDSSQRSACRIIAGRDFNEADRRDAEPVVIVSQSLAQRMFPNQDAVNRHLMWTDPVMKFIDVSTASAADRRRRRRRRRRERRARPGVERLPSVRAGDRRRPPVRAHAHGSVRAGAADHAHHPRSVGRPAGRAGGDARGRARRGAGARSAERAGVRRLRRRRAARSRSSASPACSRSRSARERASSAIRLAIGSAAAAPPDARA